MSMSQRFVAALWLGLGLLAQVVPVSAQNLVSSDTANLYVLGAGARGSLGKPQAAGRLFVQLDVVPTCTLEFGGPAGSASVRCTRGVPYRSGIIDDANPAFAGSHWLAPQMPGSVGFALIHAQRLDVEF